MTSCAVPGCTRDDIKARNLCNLHYQWAKYRGLLDSFARTTRPVAGRLCEADGCEKPVKSNGGSLCSMHQNRKYAGRPKRVERMCDVEGCGKLAHHGAICSMHSERKRKTGSVGSAAPLLQAYRGALCSVVGCDRLAKSLGFCVMHYSRFRSTGQPGEAAPKYRRQGEGSIELGYRTFAVNKKRKAEHRMVWEAANGPIPPKHVIHHKNGDKLDNRLENLELMTRSQHRKHHEHDIKSGRLG